jgi:cell wall-associated NlpC family hydrolase
MDGCDCYGLFRIVQHDKYNRHLPMFDYTIDTEMAIIDANRPLIASERLGSPLEGCLILLRYDGALRHIGLYVGNRFMLHTRPAAGSLLVSIDAISIRNRIEGFYRVN